MAMMMMITIAKDNLLQASSKLPLVCHWTLQVPQTQPWMKDYGDDGDGDDDDGDGGDNDGGSPGFTSKTMMLLMMKTIVPVGESTSVMGTVC